jgi:anaerobic selenocysteine-containing dehydrogenase
MSRDLQSAQRIQGYCALCVSRCGSIAVVENGRFTALEPDPAHPTGKALCAKGRAAPELVYHPDRLLYPMRRTRPKGDPDPGWQRISWDEAFDLAASRLKEIAQAHGPEGVAFGVASPSTSGSDDSIVWLQRLLNAFGSPNLLVSMELCGWGRYLANIYTFGASVPGVYMPDLEHAGCILFWGYNPNLARLTHATATMEALKRGARLIVVDPRRTGIAKKADQWLQVRPGSDGALALGLAHVMIANGWYDQEFLREWTNAPLLVRADTGRLLTQSNLSEQGSPQQYGAWSTAQGGLVPYDPSVGRYEAGSADLALSGAYSIETLSGAVVCKPVFELMAEMCQEYPPERVEDLTGVGRAQVVETARLLWEARPTAYYAWSGVEMQSNATQIARAIAQLYTLTGCLDSRGGNVQFPGIPAAPISGQELMPPEQSARALGMPDLPLGPARWGFATSEELYRGILEQQPYGVHGLVVFGSNLLLSHANGQRGREALQKLDFYVHCDLFMNPTAELADIVLPVASPFERQALKMGFEVSAEAHSTAQLRTAVVPARGEARSDTAIIFDLACRLGLEPHFWNGDIEAAYRYQLGPSGITLEDLRQHPGGIRLQLPERYRKFAEQQDGVPRGFNTPTRKIELYSQTLLEAGYPPLPDYEEPLVSPRSRPDLARQFPLILTCTKHTLFCESQHRALPSLRRQAQEPEVELHPTTAAERGIQEGDWVRIETPESSVRAKARFNPNLAPDVVCGQHGWWQPCPEIDAPGYDAFSSEGANFNLLIGNQAIDPISGSVPHRAYLCQVRRLEESPVV